jgi:hypothetical protein
MENPKFNLLNDSLKAIQNGSLNLLCLSGSAGFGKSYDTLKYLEDNKIDYSYFNVYSSPMAFYKNLFINKDKGVIVFDDVQNLDNPIIISILKSACWGVLDNKRIIGWHTTSEAFNKLGIDDNFILNANIVLIFNDILKDFEPIINRSVNIEFYFNFKEKIKIFEDLNLDKEIINYVKNNCSEATENLSIRTIVILSKLKKDGFQWENFANEMLKTNGENELILKLVQKCNKLEDACSEWINLTGKSRRTFFNYYSKIK